MSSRSLMLRTSPQTEFYTSLICWLETLNRIKSASESPVRSQCSVGFKVDKTNTFADRNILGLGVYTENIFSSTPEEQFFIGK